MIDNSKDKNQPIGFRLDYLPMSYEVSPVVDSPSPPPLDETFANFEPSQQVKNCVTDISFDFGKPHSFFLGISPSW